MRNILERQMKDYDLRDFTGCSLLSRRGMCRVDDLLYTSSVSATDGSLQASWVYTSFLLWLIHYSDFLAVKAM